MKLNKDTKHDVKVGDILRFDDGSEYTVTNVITAYRYANAVSFTIRDKYGRTIYAEPSSKLYGAEIIPFVDEGVNI